MRGRTGVVHPATAWSFTSPRRKRPEYPRVPPAAHAAPYAPTGGASGELRLENIMTAASVALPSRPNDTHPHLTLAPEPEPTKSREDRYRSAARASITSGPRCRSCRLRAADCRCSDDPWFLINRDHRRKSAAARMTPRANGVTDPAFSRLGPFA